MRGDSTQRRCPLRDASPQRAVEAIEDNAAWLAQNAINNKIPPPARLLKMLTAAALAAHHGTMDVQRFHPARMGLVTMVYAYSLERT